MYQIPGANGCIKGRTSPSSTPCPVTPGLQTPLSLVFSPEGRFAYVTSVFSNSVVTLERDLRTGALRGLAGARGCLADPKTPAAAGCSRRANGLLGASTIALSPDGRNAYVASINASAVAVFSRNRRTGELHPLPGSHACVRNVTATLTRCEATATGLGGARWVTVSPDGRNVYVSSPTSDAIVAFARDRRTGALRQLPAQDACIVGSVGDAPRVHCPVSAPGLNEPRMITISPDGRNAYVASDLSYTVNQFSRDMTTGALRPLPADNACIKDVDTADIVPCTRKANGLKFAFKVTISADGRFAYVAAIAGDAVAVFGRDQATGELTQLPGADACVADVHAGSNAHCPRKALGLDGAASVTISPDGRYAYVASFYGQSVAAFARNPASGGLRQLDGKAACLDDPRSSSRPATTRCPGAARGLEGPRDVVIPPDGRNAYVPVSSGGDIAAFTLG